MIGKAIDGEGEALLYVLKLNEEEGKPGVGKPLRVERRANRKLEVVEGLPQVIQAWIWKGKLNILISIR